VLMGEYEAATVQSSIGRGEILTSASPMSNLTATGVPFHWAFHTC